MSSIIGFKAMGGISNKRDQTRNTSGYDSSVFVTKEQGSCFYVPQNPSVMNLSK